MRPIQEYITEAVNNIVLKPYKYLPNYIKYADNVKIKKNEYTIFAIEQPDGYACCVYDSENETAKYVYLNSIDNIFKHFECIFNTGKTIRDAQIGPDGELTIGSKTIKGTLAAKYQKEVIRSSSDAHRVFDKEGDARGLYYILKNGGKTKGIWSIPHNNYIDRSMVDSEQVKICVDDEWYDGSTSYANILPNERLGIERGDELILLKDKMFSSVDKNNNTYIYDAKTKSVLFVIADKNFITDGGKFILCQFVKFENNTLYLTKSQDKYRLNRSDMGQINGM